MNSSILRIRDNQYEIPEVLLRVALSREGDYHFLEFNLFADSHDLTTAGFAINSMTVERMSQLEELTGFTFVLNDDIEDELNELHESVVVEPENVLELSDLAIQFGTLHDNFVDITLKATCFSPETDEENIAVSGNLVALLDVRR